MKIFYQTNTKNRTDNRIILMDKIFFDLVFMYSFIICFLFILHLVYKYLYIEQVLFYQFYIFIQIFITLEADLYVYEEIKHCFILL